MFFKHENYPYMPQATVHSSLVAEAWLAWHSMQRSMMWFLKKEHGVVPESVTKVEVHDVVP